MRAVNNSSTTTGGHGGVDGGFEHCNSPVLYLYGGLGLMLVLIAIALMMLACSFGKSPSNSTRENEEKYGKKVEEIMKLEMEPKIVVIMAGDENPRYLAMAKPAAVSACTCQVTQNV